MTLVEVMIAGMVMALILSGMLMTLIQSRTMTEGSIMQSSATAIIQGYIEQIKNLDFDSVPLSPTTQPATGATPVTVDTSPSDLVLSWGTPPTTIPAVNTTPTGATDNKPKPVDSSGNPIASIPGIPITTPYNTSNPADFLAINIWIWVNDLSDSTKNVTYCKGVVIVYTYTFQNGGTKQYVRSSVRTILSKVPTY